MIMINTVDTFVQTYISTIRTPVLTEYMYLLSRAFDFSVYSVLVTLLVALLIYMLRGKKYAILFLWVMSVSSIVVYCMKSLFNVSRPSDAVMTAFGQSFPSYHATIATVFFLMIMYICDSYLKKFWRIIFNSFCILMILLVSFSRIYLGVHWFSDILGGIVLGSVLVYLSTILFKKIWQ